MGSLVYEMTGSYLLPWPFYYNFPVRKKAQHNFIGQLKNVLNVRTILAIKLKMIEQDHMIFNDFSVNSKPISFKFCKGHFLFKS